MRVLISTAGGNTWVVLPGGCPPNTQGITPSLTCSQSRGEPFDTSRSNSWSILGNYSLGIEVNLGYNEPAAYGLDTVALGFSGATDRPSLHSQVVAGLETNDFYTGLFGLSDQPTNFTASNDSSNLTGTIPHPSFLTTMKSQNLIPSLSWAYTAGAFYRECIPSSQHRSTSRFIVQSLQTFSLRFRLLRIDTRVYSNFGVLRN